MVCLNILVQVYSTIKHYTLDTSSIKYRCPYSHESIYKLLDAAMSTNIFNTYVISFYIGGYLPTDGSPYTCSFVTTGFVVTAVILAIWCIVGIIVSFILLIITFIWRENKLVNL